MRSVTRKSLMPRVARYSMIVFALLLIIAGFRAWELFGFVFKPNVVKDTVLLIPTGTAFDAVKAQVEQSGMLANPKA
ncbi:MAG TPA: hypothetical protein PLK12_12170, partial [Prolixibacteraceae bacterium]|nr:hypothetical protein [Prolixibacteraceae bacterium]